MTGNARWCSVTTDYRRRERGPDDGATPRPVRRWPSPQAPPSQVSGGRAPIDRPRPADRDQNGGSPLQAFGFAGSGAFETGTSESETSESETSDPGTSGIRYRIGSRSQRTPFGSIHSLSLIHISEPTRRTP